MGRPALKQVIVYLGLTVIFGLAIALLLRFAPTLLGVTDGIAPSKSEGEVHLPFLANLRGSLGIFLLQVLLVVAAAKIAGVFMSVLGQPRVVGEMIAGILLGPSFFGWIAPNLHQFVFSLGSLDALKALSQIGVVFFIFCVGLELDGRSIRRNTSSALAISHFSIFLPFLLGAVMAVWLYRNYAPSSVDVRAFLLFIGIAMSITAFPVLASICRERGLLGSPLGGLALACAAIDDVTAWLGLAGIIAFARAEGMLSTAMTLITSLVYCGAMLWFIKPYFDKLKVDPNINPGKTMFQIVILVFGSSLLTEFIGIHALFGAFMAGFAASGNSAIRHLVEQRIEPFATVVLLPLFFCYAGLRTDLALIDNMYDWFVCAVVIGLATLGKLGGGAIAARAMGHTWRQSLSLGALMNTRGLMELVVLNIGLDLGIITSRLFSIMVIMALVTTLMTGPLLSIFHSNRSGALLR